MLESQAGMDLVPRFDRVAEPAGQIVHIQQCSRVPKPRRSHRVDLGRSTNRIRIDLRSRVNVRPVCSWRCSSTRVSS
jgi:hypothetical protein